MGRGDRQQTPTVGLATLAFCAFAGVSTEMAPVGLLPAIATAFTTSETQTGLLVSLYAVLVALLAVPITHATRRLPVKHLLFAGAASYGLSSLVCAIAPNFATLAAGRTIGGVTHALFFSCCIGYAARLVPPDRTGRALALASAGGSAGFLLGVPMVTAVGDAAGWRWAFAVLVGLMAVAGVGIVLFLPDLRRGPAGADGVQGRRREAGAAIGANTVTFAGHYVAYTYVTLLLLRSGLPSAGLAPILFGFGALGLLGIWRAAPQLDRRPRASALTILIALTVGLAGVGAGLPALVPVLIAAAVWGTAFGPVGSLFQSAAIRARAFSPELSGAWINATSNVGIAAGAGIGGVALDHWGVSALPWIGAALSLVGAVIVLMARRAFPPTAVRPTPSADHPPAPGPNDDRPT
ncbi:MAG: MFS transporter [Propionibacteriaceae bacterium]|jgi:predicted MFS family arabinose efflux permease|nr:MFS transporter [Propionibacteriaceae bacterium]